MPTFSIHLFITTLLKAIIPLYITIINMDRFRNLFRSNRVHIEPQPAAPSIPSGIAIDSSNLTLQQIEETVKKLKEEIDKTEKERSIFVYTAEQAFGDEEEIAIIYAEYNKIFTPLIKQHHTLYRLKQRELHDIRS